MGRKTKRPLGALGDTLIEDIARSLSGNAFNQDYFNALHNKAATADSKKAQESRSSKYGIAIKENGNVTKPSEWSDVSDDDFGDPVNYRYPMPNADQTAAAARYWGKESNRKQYSSEEQAIISKRIESHKKKYDIGEEEDKKSIEPTDADRMCVKDLAPVEELENEGGEVEGPDLQGNIPAKDPNETADKLLEHTAEEDGEELNPGTEEELDATDPDEDDSDVEKLKDKTESDVVENAFTGKLDNPSDNKDVSIDHNVSEKVATTDTDPHANEDEPVTKGITVAGELYDEPIQMELYDIFNGFMSACYKLSIAAEANEQPMTAEFLALVDQLAALLKRAIIEENEEDTFDGDGTADDFVGEYKESDKILIRKLATSLLTKAGKRHNKADLQTFKGVHDAMAALDESICPAMDDDDDGDEKSAQLAETLKKVEEAKNALDEFNEALTSLKSEQEELETRVQSAEQTVTQLDEQIVEKTKQFESLQATIEQKTEEYNNIMKKAVPKPTETRQDVVVERVLSSKPTKTYVTLHNSEFLSLKGRIK